MENPDFLSSGQCIKVGVSKTPQGRLPVFFVRNPTNEASVS